MAEAVSSGVQDDAIARDQAQQAWARDMRLAQLRSRRLATGSISSKSKGALSNAFAQAEQLQALIKQARNVRTVLTVAGGLTSLTGLGILWTFIQWNIQSIWTVFGLPGKDFIGMPWFMVGVVILFDVVVFILGLVILFIGYAASHPAEAFCLLVKPLFGDHWYTSLLQIGLSLFGQCPK